MDITETQEIVLAATVKRSAIEQDIKPYPKFENKIIFLKMIYKPITCKLLKEIISNRKRLTGQ